VYIYIGTFEPRLMQKVGRTRKASTNLNPYKQEMLALYEQGNSFATIRISLMDNYGVEVGLSALYRQMKRWGAGGDVDS
jgi:transposase